MIPYFMDVSLLLNPLYTEGYMGEQASLEFDLTFDDVLLHKLAYTQIWGQSVI